MDTILQDIRFGFRMLVKHPGSTAIAAVALALGIGLTGMMFSIVYGAMFRGLPFPAPEQIVTVFRTNPSEGVERMSTPVHDFVDWRAEQRSFSDLAGYYTGTVNVSTAERPERFDGGFITPNTFRLLGVQPIMGRDFTDADDVPGAERVMVLSYETWQNHFGGDPAVVGRVIRANARPTTIIGVMPDGFRFPTDEQLWVPLGMDAAALQRGQGMWLSVVGRLRDGVTADQAMVELTGIARRLEEAYPDTNRGVSVSVLPFVEGFLGREAVAMLYTMLGAVFMVLLVACANVANLLISRAASRSREVGIRSAMGASKVRIVRQFLTESFILALAGAAVGLVLAWVGIRIFNNAIAPTNPPFWIRISLDGGPLLFVLGVTLFASLVAGSIPALQAARANVNDVLKDESRGSSSFRLGRISRALVVAEIALSAGLLVGAGLMIKSVTRVRNVDMPFTTADAFTARIGLPEAQYADAAQQRQFFEQLLPRLRELPQVAGVGLIQGLPGVGNSPQSRFAMDDATYQEERDFPTARSILVVPGTFEALGAPVRQGRDFAGTDHADGLPVAVVNDAWVRKFSPGQDPVGRRVRLGGRDSEQEWRTIVGVVPDMYIGGLQEESTQEAIFHPLAQGSARFMSVVARGRTGEPMALAQPVREAVLAVDADLPIYFVQTLKKAIDDGNWFYMIFGSLFMVFGAAALFLASVGLYGVMATSVSQRTREMGVRMALGAEQRDVLGLVMRQGMLQLGIGLVLGLGLALALGAMNVLSMLLFDVAPWDPAVFIGIAAVLTLVAAAACFIPANRATRVQPVQALRYD
jgi:putative ABC transport system permease protein